MKNRKTNTWLLIIAIFLIILLFIWLTVADSVGDTDVSAQILEIPFLITNFA